MAWYVLSGGKNGMGCFVMGDRNDIGYFWGCKYSWDVLSWVSKNVMGCFVPGWFVLHSVSICMNDSFRSVN